MLFRSGAAYVGSYKSTPPEGGYPRNVHPVVAVHPVTGKKVLFVNSGFTSHIQEMEGWESRALLDALFAHIATTPRLHCRVEWRPNTLTLWDNRCTQHHVLNDFEGERVIQRVTVMGDEPQPAAPPRYEPFDEKFSAASWRDLPLTSSLRRDPE